MTEVDEVGLDRLLGARAGRSLRDWADLTGRHLHIPADQWQGEGYTGARLAPLYVQHPGLAAQLVVVKRIPRGHTGEPGAHARALHESPAAFRRHLVAQPFDALPMPCGDVLMFQQLAGDGHDLRPMADLSATDRPAACAAIITALIADWNPDLGVRAEAVVPHLRAEAGTLGSIGRAAAELPWSAGSDPGRSRPHPLRMLDDDSPFTDRRTDLLVGRTHGDLHDQNVLTARTSDPADPFTFVIVDLSGYASRAPISRDPVTLMLSTLARLLPSLSWHQWRLLRTALVTPGTVPSSELPQLVVEILRAGHGTTRDLVRSGGTHVWHRQYLLALAAYGLRFATFDDLGVERRRWFLHLAGDAGQAAERTFGIHLAVSPPELASTTVDAGPSLPRPTTSYDGWGLRSPASTGRDVADRIDGADPTIERPPPAGPRHRYPGSVKVRFCRLIGDDWADVADYFGIPAYERARYPRGREAARVWEWLEPRGRLHELPSALRWLGRPDIADGFDDEP
jgi:hypothetical protein